jgi:hypothetical protein
MALFANCSQSALSFHEIMRLLESVTAADVEAMAPGGAGEVRPASAALGQAGISPAAQGRAEVAQQRGSGGVTGGTGLCAAIAILTLSKRVGHPPPTLTGPEGDPHDCAIDFDPHQRAAVGPRALTSPGGDLTPTQACRRAVRPYTGRVPSGRRRRA